MSQLSGNLRQTRSHFAVNHSDAEWRSLLSPEAYHVLRKHGTERAGTSPLDDETRRGLFACAGCHQSLFRSETKFNSFTDWPSFSAPLPGAVETKTDHTLVVARTEVHCAQCGGHLGHVFTDAPTPTGERYCVNGIALAFEPD
jgi:peptide-methionine (R)-S-oxide reductase